MSVSLCSGGWTTELGHRSLPLLRAESPLAKLLRVTLLSMCDCVKLNSSLPFNFKDAWTFKIAASPISFDAKGSVEITSGRLLFCQD